MSRAQIAVLGGAAARHAVLPSAARLSEFAWAALGDQEGELNLRIVSLVESQRLNAQFRGKQAPTNVLSFPADVPAEWPIKLIGDLALCAEVIAREADEQGKSLEAHWAHMVIHGCLHLLGLDHLTDAEAAVMEAREIALLADLGFADPYQLPESTEGTA